MAFPGAPRRVCVLLPLNTCDLALRTLQDYCALCLLGLLCAWRAGTTEPAGGVCLLCRELTHSPDSECLHAPHPFWVGETARRQTKTPVLGSLRPTGALGMNV